MYSLSITVNKVSCPEIKVDSLSKAIHAMEVLTSRFRNIYISMWQNDFSFVCDHYQEDGIKR